ncbi:unnamed protein product [Symbiodinium microadriaticum]|nr:unnamed protein product [Symbiodinium microadriaticum]
MCALFNLLEEVEERDVPLSHAASGWLASVARGVAALQASGSPFALQQVGTHLDFLGPQELKDPSLEGSPASIGSWELSIYCSTRESRSFSVAVVFGVGFPKRSKNETSTCRMDALSSPTSLVMSRQLVLQIRISEVV